jgi:hypothetical protein
MKYQSAADDIATFQTLSIPSVDLELSFQVGQ